MSNSVAISSKASGTSATSATAATDSVKSAADSANVSPAAKAKLQLNASIVQASLSVSLSSQNNSQSLVFKTALDGINEALKADYGEDAIQGAVSQDNTPEGTASRIVSLSTAFFDSFKKQNPGMGDDEVLQKFMDTIGGGMEKGFKEARDVLQGLGALGGDIASNIDKTFELVQKGYADFVAAHQSASADAGTADGSAASATATASSSASVTLKTGTS